MERRRFIGCAAAAAPLLGSVAVAEEAAEPTEKPKKKKVGCKITVVRRSVHKNLAAKWAPGYDVKPCEVTHEGQEFFVDSPWNPPKGMCPWAWGDMRTYIMANLNGGSRPLVACCTDGLRPVHYLIEPVELEG